jgi:hypothetical protein
MRKECSQIHHPCNLPLVATTWDRLYGSGAVRPRGEPRIPDYITVLSTISELEFVCGLALSNIFEPDSALKSRASGMHYAPSEGFKLNTVPEEKLNSDAVDEGLRESGPDWLGLYSHSSDSPTGLELHLSRCYSAARVLGVTPQKLLDVVLTHEVAHFVSHMGLGGYGRTRWEKFSTASRANKEHVAQVVSWGAFTIFGRSDLTAVMRKLATRQSSIYNSWQAFEIDSADVKYQPLDLIAKLTLEVARYSGRKVHIDRDEMLNLENIDE